MNIETYRKIHANKRFDWDRWNAEWDVVFKEMTPDLDLMIKEEVPRLIGEGHSRDYVKNLLLEKFRQIRSDAEDKLFEERFA